MIAMNAALEDVYKKVFADSYQHGAPLSSRGAWKRRGDFDRMNRYQLIDILIEEDNPGWTLFSFAMCWLDARVIDRWTGELHEWRDRPNLKSSSLSWWRILIDWQTEPIRRNKKHEIRGGKISDSELLDSMDGGRALQLKHEINVESTIIDRGTAKRDRDQHLVVYIGWGKAPFFFL